MTDSMLREKLLLALTQGNRLHIDEARARACLSP